MKSIPKNYPHISAALSAEDAVTIHSGAYRFSIDYPLISEQPEFKAANEKLISFTQQRAVLQTRLDLSQAQLAQDMKKANEQEKGLSDIGEAERILSGVKSESLAAQSQSLFKDIDVLQRAEAAQRQLLKSLNDDLSRRAGLHFTEQHKAKVKRVIDAITELHLANVDEAVIRDDLVRLGYIGATIPVVTYLDAHDPDDSTGSPAYYWQRDAALYVQTPEQKATIVGKSLLQTILG